MSKSSKSTFKSIFGTIIIISIVSLFFYLLISSTSDDVEFENCLMKEAKKQCHFNGEEFNKVKVLHYYKRASFSCINDERSLMNYNFFKDEIEDCRNE